MGDPENPAVQTARDCASQQSPPDPLERWAQARQRSRRPQPGSAPEDGRDDRSNQGQTVMGGAENTAPGLQNVTGRAEVQVQELVIAVDVGLGLRIQLLAPASRLDLRLGALGVQLGEFATD